MNRSGKIWGSTELVHSNGMFEFHRINAKKGGVCSKHKHQFKWNGFFVESGHLLIRVWKNDYALVDETHLYAGDFMQVKPGEFHQFEAIEDTVAFELYWAEFDSNDIVRETVGKITNSADDIGNLTVGNLKTTYSMNLDDMPSAFKPIQGDWGTITITDPKNNDK